MYTIIPSSRFEREYKKLTAAVEHQVDKALDLLAEDARHPSLRVHKRRGEGEMWQARVSRDFRSYFEMEGERIRLITVTAHEK